MSQYEDLQAGPIFPRGDKVGENFLGDAYLEMLYVDEKPLNGAIGNVTFAPGARNNWHVHDVGQILLVTGGEGWYQEWEQPARHLQKGDVVTIPADVKHWHGATKEAWFVHLAISPGGTTWLEEVAEADYLAL
ncbi:cupin domain-containing protein [Listeria costaricensis]|uniref:cupin domain-containing protein n=1 Tax=Listeria costaricensis TaxID=2026604 RepID=UPI000C077E33|nr:cupin domain-containing protein [Listeria costaricensis]